MSSMRIKHKMSWTPRLLSDDALRGVVSGGLENAPSSDSTGSPSEGCYSLLILVSGHFKKYSLIATIYNAMTRGFDRKC